MRSIAVALLLLVSIGCEKRPAAITPAPVSPTTISPDAGAPDAMPDAMPDASMPAPPPAPVVRTGTIWPFHEYVRAEVISFNQIPMRPGVPLLAYSDEVGWSQQLASRRAITDAQMKAAVRLVDSTKGGVEVSKCPFPRHAIVLFDRDDVPVASINVCFQCGDILIWPDWSEAPRDWDTMTAQQQQAELRRMKAQMRLYESAFPRWKALFRDELGFTDLDTQWREAPPLP